jgi:hypothetical protein
MRAPCMGILCQLIVFMTVHVHIWHAKDDSCRYTVMHAGTRWFTMNGRDHSLFRVAMSFVRYGPS